MACPLYRRTIPATCQAVGVPTPPGREIAAALCRADFGACPAYRFVKAAGRSVNSSDFDAWVVRQVRSGRTDPPAATPDPDADSP
jgi:hypothetical protein